MLLSEIKEKVSRPTKFTLLAIEEAERIEAENKVLKSKIKDLQSTKPENNSAFIGSGSIDRVMNMNRSMEEKLNAANSTYITITYLGSTEKGNSVFLRNDSSNMSILVFEGDVRKSINKVQNPHLSSLNKEYFNYGSLVADQELLTKLSGRFNRIFNIVSDRKLDSISGKQLIFYNVNTNINNCGALLVSGIDYRDYEDLNSDFMESISYCLGSFQKYLAIGTDYEGGGFDDIISGLDNIGYLNNVPPYYIHRGEAYENKNSGNYIYSFQIYMG